MASITDLVKWSSPILLVDLFGYGALTGNFNHYYTLHAAFGIAQGADTYVSILEACVLALGVSFMMYDASQKRAKKE